MAGLRTGAKIAGAAAYEAAFSFYLGTAHRQQVELLRQADSLLRMIRKIRRKAAQDHQIGYTGDTQERID